MKMREADSDPVQCSTPDSLGAADLAEADGLIADLEALVDAGLVIVEQHVRGPARYGVAFDSGSGAHSRFGGPLARGHIALTVRRA